MISLRDTTIVGDSMWSGSARSFAEQAAAAPAPVLLIGPAGSGREHLGRAIHAQSKRRERPFVPIQAPPADSPLFLAQIFGRDRPDEEGQPRGQASLGGLRAADGGAAMFCDFDLVPPAIQDRLIRFLATGRLTPVDGQESVAVNAQVIFSIQAAQDDPADSIKRLVGAIAKRRGRIFRTLPLAQRPDDLAPLVAHFWRRVETERATESFRGPSPAEIVEAITRSRWSGGMADLKALVEELSAGRKKPDESIGAFIGRSIQQSPPAPAGAAER